jgi:membrane protease YdiL (CAAX protease family)
MRSRRALFVGLSAPAWILGFLVLRFGGSVRPLFGMALVLAAGTVLADPETRRLLKPRPGPLAIGAAAGAVMIAATYLLYPLCVRLWTPLGGQVHDLYQLLFRGQDRAFLAVVVGTMSICEEILFRGWLLTPTGGGGRAARLVVASLFYASIHCMSGSPLLIALALVCGLVWGLLRNLTDSLWTSVVCHVTWDLAIMVISPLARL